MRRAFITLGSVTAFVSLAVLPLRADVRTEEKSQVQFTGALGKMVNMFGGKAAREGVSTKVAVKGDRKMSITEERGQLIDLADEKVYEIDFGSKSYKVMTFAEMRQKMQEAQEKAKEQMAKSKDEKPQPSEPQKKMAIDVVSKETGQKKTVNGFDCREVVTTATVHEDGKTIEESGGLVLTTDSWLTSPIAAMSEVQDFDRRYFEKLSGMDATAAAQQMAAALAMYPALKDALGKVRVEGAKLEGTAISTSMTVEAVKNPEQTKQESEQQQDSGGGGLSGMLARKMMKKKAADDTEGGAKNRASVMTTTHDVLSVATDVPADAVSVPAGFKNKS